jgi:hypothetical protein
MDSIRLYKLPNLEGGIDLITENGKQIDEAEFNAVNKERGRKSGFVYQSAAATPEMIENHYTELMFDRVTTDEELQAVAANAKAETNKYLGIEEPVIQKAAPKTGNTIAERREALKQESRGQRMAADVFRKDLDAQLIPWAQRTRGVDGLEPWIGQTAPQFRQRINELTEEIRRSPSSTQMEGMLIDKYGYTPGGAERAVRKVRNMKAFPSLKLGEPNFTADERIAASIMQGSGIEDVRDWNRMDPVTATDLMAQIGPGPLKGVDAQRRFRPELAIAVLQGLNKNQRAAITDAKEDGNKKLGQLLDLINTQDTLEDKLLHTQAYMRGKPSQRMEDDELFANYRKDYLISGDMNSYQQDDTDSQIFERARGPYNPRVADSYAMINLNNMREELFGTKIRELESKGYALETDRKGKLKLIVPQLEIPRFTSSNLLDQSIIDEAVSRGKPSRRRSRR